MPTLSQSLDEVTLEAVAAVICGDEPGSPVYRTGYDLTRFFRRAGASRFEHDGSTRKWWTLDALNNCTPAELERVILRLCSPLEYSGDETHVTAVIGKVNDALGIEGYEVQLVDGVPEVREIEVRAFSRPRAAVDEVPDLPRPDFGGLGLDAEFVRILDERWTEVERCVGASAHLAAVILMGSLLEGVLLAVCLRRSSEALTARSAPRRRDGKPVQIADWKLSSLIDVASEVGWIDLDVNRFSHALRDFRNLIHPKDQLAKQAFPDRDTVEVSWRVVRAAMNDIVRTLRE